MINFAKYGLQVSAQISEEYITALADEVRKAYITPIQAETEIDTSQEDIEAIASEIEAKSTWLLLTKRQYKVTRAGVKLKTTTESQAPTEWQILASVSASVAYLLQQYAKLLEVCLIDCQVVDICGVYFTTNYFYYNNL